MTKHQGSQTASPAGSAFGVAKLKTLSLAFDAMERIKNASPELPRMAVMSAPPGYGKTTALSTLAHPQTFNGVYVSVRPFDTTKSLAHLLLRELGVSFKPSWPVTTLYDHICEALQMRDRPLLIDEVDHIAETKAIEFIRSIHDITHCPVMLIGEQELKGKLLNNHSRFHDRVLVWVKAVKLDLEDAGRLAAHQCPDITFDQDLLADLVEASEGVTRRAATMLDGWKETAKRKGVKHLGVGDVSVEKRRGR